MDCELSVIIPTCGRCEKLDTLVSGIAGTASDHEAFEVVVVVDGPDEHPLEVGARLPADIRFTGLTKPHGGAAAARDRRDQAALAQPRGDPAGLRAGGLRTRLCRWRRGRNLGAHR